MASFGKRLQHAWNAFRNNRDPTDDIGAVYNQPSPINVGYASSTRPDRLRMTRGKDRSMPADEEISAYNSIVIRKLLPHDYITHNAVIPMTLELFKKHVSVKAFYSNYYPLIIVDEFQDTNCIAWNLIDQLIGSNTKLLFLGDPLQRIYGFIGALPSLLDNATKQYSMKKVTLSKNYRSQDHHFKWWFDIAPIRGILRATA